MGSQASMLLTEAVPGSRAPGVGRLDMPRWGDGSSQRMTPAGHGHSVGNASIYVSPNLCPGLPYIRSTRGSSYGDDPLLHA